MLSREFVLAGRAVFTVSNPQGLRYTFKVTGKKGTEGRGPVWFVSLLTGPDNESDYTYMGILDAEIGRITLTKASRYNYGSMPVKVAQWACTLIWKGAELPEGYSIHHEGRCGRCGRALTVPESVDSGFGPECITKVFA